VLTGINELGSETTAVAMSGLFHYLARNPKIYSKLACEIHSTFSSAFEILPGERLQSCSYLSACIWEALRVCPPVPGIPWREVGEGGIVVDNEFIPAGYDVGTSIYLIQHNPAYFSAPYTFGPERWLKSSCSEEQKSLADAAFNPFSIGPRRCAGQSMALLELKLMVARTLFTFDFRFARGTNKEASRGGSKLQTHGEEFQLYAHVTSYCEVPQLVFKKR
jgi:cytochrome P450